MLDRTGRKIRRNSKENVPFVVVGHRDPRQWEIQQGEIVYGSFKESPRPRLITGGRRQVEDRATASKRLVNRRYASCEQTQVNVKFKLVVPHA